MSCSARLGPHSRARLALHARSLPSRGLRTLAASGPLATTSPIGKATSGAFGSRDAQGRGGAGRARPAASARLLICICHALLVTSPALSPTRIRRCLAGGAGAGGRVGTRRGPPGRGGGNLREDRISPRPAPSAQRPAPSAQQLGPTEGSGSGLGVGLTFLSAEESFSPFLSSPARSHLQVIENSGKALLPVDSAKPLNNKSCLCFTHGVFLSQRDTTALQNMQ